MQTGGIAGISFIAICILGLFIIAIVLNKTPIAPGYKAMYGGNYKKTFNRFNNIYQQISSVSSFFK